MHTYVHCSTIYNTKDLEPTHMPINDRLDKENVAHIHHGILCSHKNNEFMSFVGTWMNLETIILNKLTQEQKIKHHMFSLRRVLNNENTWTQGQEHHTLRSEVGELGEEKQGVGSWGGITLREMPDIRDGEEDSKPHFHVCTYAIILHVFHMYPKT